MRFLDAYRRLSYNLQQASQSLYHYQGQAATWQTMETNLRAAENALRQSNTELEDKKREVLNKQRDMLKAQTMLGEQHAKHGREVNELQIKIQQLQRDHTEQIHKARSEDSQRQEHEISGLKQRLTDEHGKWTAHVAAVKAEHEKHISNAQPEFDRRWNEREEQLNQQMAAEREKYDESVAEHEMQISHLKTTAEEEQQRLHDQVQNEQKKLQEEQTRRANELKKQEAHLTQKHTHETLQLRTVNEELKQGLFQREHFKGLRDRDLTSKFRIIMGQVQDFANLEWDSRWALDWPCSEHQLLEIHRDNTRKLKKQIVQNTLWVLLYNHIFASPFRILGAEGRDLDSDWILIHTSGESSMIKSAHLS
jgi:hypothetical protein